MKEHIDNEEVATGESSSTHTDPVCEDWADAFNRTKRKFSEAIDSLADSIDKTLEERHSRDSKGVPKNDRGPS